MRYSSLMRLSRVFDHLFAVSAADGGFTLKIFSRRLHAEAWHERFGVQTQKITLGAKETKEIIFTFKAS
jgi:hypothetical protein